MGASTDVAKLACAFLPYRPVSLPDTHHGVGDLVEKDLVHLVIFGACGQITRDRDPSLGVIALPKARFCMVKTKAPRRIKMQSNQCVRPHGHSLQLCHGARLARAFSSGSFSPQRVASVTPRRETNGSIQAKASVHRLAGARFRRRSGLLLSPSSTWWDAGLGEPPRPTRKEFLSPLSPP